MAIEQTLGVAVGLIVFLLLVAIAPLLRRFFTAIWDLLDGLLDSWIDLRAERKRAAVELELTEARAREVTMARAERLREMFGDSIVELAEAVDKSPDGGQWKISDITLMEARLQYTDRQLMFALHSSFPNLNWSVWRTSPGFTFTFEWSTK